ncbi:MAG: hypothetical protein WBA74_06460 [Cyclobacteriaceae bacterium]
MRFLRFTIKTWPYIILAVFFRSQVLSLPQQETIISDNACCNTQISTKVLYFPGCAELITKLRQKPIPNIAYVKHATFSVKQPKSSISKIPLQQTYRCFIFAS